MHNPVRATTNYVVTQARHVTINREQINRRAQLFAHKQILIPPWPRDLHLVTPDKKVMLTYLIMLDALNFCFWNTKNKWRIIYQGKTYSGYDALAIALKRFFENYHERATLKNLATTPFKDFKALLGGTGELLLMKKRWEITRAVAAALLKKYRGNPETLIKSANHTLSQLVPTIARTLPSFNDTALYKGKKVYLLKRAQILAGDIIGAFDGKGFGEFSDPEYLTAFADYRLPQILHHWNILEYSLVLEKKIARHSLIKAGSPEEIEIRAATIQAIERLHDALSAHGTTLHAYQLDWLLWNTAKATKNIAPHHLTKTIYY